MYLCVTAMIIVFWVCFSHSFHFHVVSVVKSYVCGNNKFYVLEILVQYVKNLSDARYMYIIENMCVHCTWFTFYFILFFLAPHSVGCVVVFFLVCCCFWISLINFHQILRRKLHSVSLCDVFFMQHHSSSHVKCACELKSAFT